MMVRWTDAAMHGIAPATVRGGRDLVSEEWTSALSTCCTSGQHWSPTEARLWLVPLSLSRHAPLPVLGPAGPPGLGQAGRAAPDQHWSPTEMRFWLVPLSLSRHALLPLLVPAGPHELDQADRAEPEHLESVPRAQQVDEVEPAPLGSRLCDDVADERDRGEVRDGEQHRGDTPFEAAPGHHCVADAGGRQIPAEGVSGDSDCFAATPAALDVISDGHCGPPGHVSVR